MSRIDLPAFQSWLVDGDDSRPRRAGTDVDVGGWLQRCR